MSLKTCATLSLLAIAALSGCGDRIFHADFEADPMNGTPALYPPTEPAGDEVHAPPPARVLVGDATRYGFTGKAVYYTAVNQLTPILPIKFVAKPVSGRSSNYFVGWKFAWLNNGRALDIRIENGTGALLAALQMSAGGGAYHAVLADGSWRSLGRRPREVAHDFVVHVNRTAGTYSVMWIPEPGAELEALGTFPLRSAAAITRPTLVFSYPSIGGTRVIVDDVLMTEACFDPDFTVVPCE